jgi:membrane associated rhomboid family serine protease
MRSKSENAPLWVLIGINILVFILTSIRPDIGDQMAMSKPLSDSGVYTILTSIFVHANFTHILFNMLALYFFGIFCLQLIEAKWFITVYIIGGIMGNILFLLIGPSDSLVVGASGAIFAVGGVIAAMRPTQRVYAYFVIPMPLWVFILGSFAILVFIPGVAWQGHLGGLLVGIAAGLFFRQREQKRLGPEYYQFRS